MDYIYYTDTSGLLENIPVVKFIKTTSGTRVLSIISHVSLSKSSAIFRHLRKFSEIFGKCSETFVRKSSESGRKSSENQQKRRHQHVFTVEPRFNEVTGDRPNLFVKWRVRYIENLDIRNLTGNDQKVRYTEVIVND